MVGYSDGDENVRESIIVSPSENLKRAEMNKNQHRFSTEAHNGNPDTDAQSSLKNMLKVKHRSIVTSEAQSIPNTIEEN